MSSHAKQQALMFVLGALLVGGVLGFSADRYMRHRSFVDQYGPLRGRFYDDLGLSQQQRATLDSLASAQDCSMRAIFRPLQPAVDSIRNRFNAQVATVLTQEQQAKLDARRKDVQARRKAERAKEPQKQCSQN